MNRATRTIVSTLGVMLAIAGIDHGFFETLQGNTPTPGLIIQAIGEGNRMWMHGTEEAFTVVPNFLITGILAITISLAIIVWSLGFVQKRHGATVFILLCVLLFLVGGGVGQIAFFIPTWLFATRINKPLAWWRKVLPQTARRGLANWWPVSLAAGLACFLIALEIAIFGFFPGLSDPDLILYVCWTFLFVALGLVFFTFVSGFACDIQKLAEVGSTA